MDPLRLFGLISECLLFTGGDPSRGVSPSSTTSTTSAPTSTSTCTTPPGPAAPAARRLPQLPAGRALERRGERHLPRLPVHPLRAGVSSEGAAQVTFPDAHRGEASQVSHLLSLLLPTRKPQRAHAHPYWRAAVRVPYLSHEVLPVE